MDRLINYPGQIPLETDLLNTNRNVMVALAMLTQDLVGASTVVGGLNCTPNSPAALNVVIGPGTIYSLQNLDSTAFSSLPADTTHQVMKQGIQLDSVTLSCAAPSTAGYSVNYLIEAAYQDVDSTPVTLPYYNSANPSQAYSGPNNSGSAQSTVRKGTVVLQAKAGIAAATGTQQTPAPDAGFVGLWVVTVANGQTSITSSNITGAVGAPWVTSIASGIKVVDTIAALRALPSATFKRAFVTGYYAAGDGGGGNYWYNAADSTSSDNGGSIVVASDGGRWYLHSTNVVTVKQFGAKGDGVTDDSTSIQNAMNATKGGVRFPSGFYGLGKPLYVTPTSVQNLSLIGDSRTNTYLLPLAINIADANGVNALIINQAANNKLCIENLRFWSSVAFNGTGIYASTAAASGKVIFSGYIDRCWIDFNTSGSPNFFTGGLINFRVSNCTFEFIKGAFNLTDTTSDVLFEDNVYSAAYDYFIQSSLAGQNMISVKGLHAYTHNRGVLFPISNATDLTFMNVNLQGAVPNFGNVGLWALSNCNNVKINGFSALGNSVATSAATAATTTTVLNDSTQSWGVNQYVGYTLYNVTRNLSATITGNTATSLTTAGIAGQSAGDTYQLVWPGSQPLGLGQLGTQITLTASQVSMLNGNLLGCDTGILTQGAGALDLHICQVNIRQTNTAAFKNLSTGGTPSGIVKVSNCNWSDGITNLVLFTASATYDFYLDGVRLLNAGLGGGVSSRNLTTATSGLHRVADCVIGQNNVLSLASYYLDLAGSGQAVLIDPTFVGNPPTGIQNASATQIASIGRLVVPFNAGAPVFSTAISDKFTITCTGNVVVGAPTNPCDGKSITVTIRNTSGGAITVGWNGVFKVPAGLTAPANGNSRTYGFHFDGANWVFMFQSSADVPN